MNKRHLLLALTLALGTSASSWAVTKLSIAVDGEKLAFTKKELSAKAGEDVEIEFKNTSKSMQHNLVIAKPGTGDKVVMDSMAAGADAGWVSKGPEVVAKTAMIDPTKSATLKFKVPSEKGDYPFMCTFPGHGTVMKGIFKVK